MSREVMKSFTKYITVPSTGTVIVELRDTAGNFFDCTYVHVRVSETPPDAWFWAAPSGLNVSPYAQPKLNPSSTTLTSSGSAGAVCHDLVSFETADPINSILIFNGAGATVGYGIVYGVKKTVNALSNHKKSPGL